MNTESGPMKHHQVLVWAFGIECVGVMKPAFIFGSSLTMDAVKGRFSSDALSLGVNFWLWRSRIQHTLCFSPVSNEDTSRPSARGSQPSPRRAPIQQVFHPTGTIGLTVTLVAAVVHVVAPGETYYLPGRMKNCWIGALLGLGWLPLHKTKLAYSTRSLSSLKCSSFCMIQSGCLILAVLR